MVFLKNWCSDYNNDVFNVFKSLRNGFKDSQTDVQTTNTLATIALTSSSAGKSHQLDFEILQMCESETATNFISKMVSPHLHMYEECNFEALLLPNQRSFRSEANFTINTSGAGLFEVRNVGNELSR